MNDREFKQLLFDRFSKTGLDKEIRTNIAEKLVKDLKTTKSPLPSQTSKREPSAQELRNQITLSIILDFLDKKRCTTSKEVVEAEFKDTPVLLSDQLLSFFDHVPAVSIEVNPNSKLFAHRQPLSVLERLVGHSMYQKTIGKLTRATQTETDESYMLHNQLKALDDKFANLAQPLQTTQSNNLTDLQKLLREEHEATLRREILAFKIGEMRQYRISVDLDADRKVRDREIALEKAYAARLSSLQEREKHLYSAIERQANDLEKNMNDNRKKQLLTIVDIEQRERELRREREIRLADIEAREFKLAEQEKMIEVKMRDVDDLKTELAFNNQQIEKRMRVEEVLSERRNLEEHGYDGRRDGRDEEKVYGWGEHEPANGEALGGTARREQLTEAGRSRQGQ